MIAQVTLRVTVLRETLTQLLFQGPTLYPEGAPFFSAICHVTELPPPDDNDNDGAARDSTTSSRSHATSHSVQ